MAREKEAFPFGFNVLKSSKKKTGSKKSGAGKSKKRPPGRFKNGQSWS